MRGTVRLRGRLTAQTRCCDPRRRAPTRDVNRVFCEIDKKSMSVLGLAEPARARAGAVNKIGRRIFR